MSWANEGDDSANPFASTPASVPAPAQAHVPAPPPEEVPAAPGWLSTPESVGGKDTTPQPSTDLRPPSPPNETQQQQQQPVHTQQEKRTSALQMNAVALQDMEARQNSADPPKAVVYLRLINLLVSVGVCVLASLCVISTSTTSTTKAIMSVYVFMFGFMICCFEMQFKAFANYITANFGFFFDAKMRTLFLLFVSLLCFDLGVLGIIMGSGLLFCAGLNAYALCKYPEFILPQAVSEEQKKAATAKAINAGTSAAIQGAAWHQQAGQAAA